MNMSWKWAVGALSLAVVLIGCGAKEEAATQQQNQAQTQGGTQQSSGGGGGGPQMGMQADLMGKVKSIDGQTITVYKSNMTFGGDRGQGDGTGQTPEDGQPAEGGEMPQPPADGGPVNMDDMFSDETTTIQLTDYTKILSVTFENNEIVEKTVTLADLKVDDILSINLKDDTLEAESITIRTGGFGGGGGRQRPNEQQQQSL